MLLFSNLWPFLTASCNFSVGLKVLSTTPPDITFLSLVLTHAAPLPGLTCKKSVTVNTCPSNSKVVPFLKSPADIIKASSLYLHLPLVYMKRHSKTRHFLPGFVCFFFLLRVFGREVRVRAGVQTARRRNARDCPVQRESRSECRKSRANGYSNRFSPFSLPEEMREKKPIDAKRIDGNDEIVDHDSQAGWQ